MELDITDFFNSCVPRQYSASVAELGNDAGPITWQNALDRSEEDNLLDTEEKREAFKAYVRGFVAWDDEEIAAWSHEELNALLIQFISGGMREDGLHANMEDEEWNALDPENSIGRIYGGPLTVDGRVYFYMGD